MKRHKLQIHLSMEQLRAVYVKGFAAGYQQGLFTFGQSPYREFESANIITGGMGTAPEGETWEQMQAREKEAGAKLL